MITTYDAGKLGRVTIPGNGVRAEKGILSMTAHTTLRLDDDEREGLATLAAQLGYIRRINGVDVPDMSGLVKAIARGELEVKQAEKEEAR